MAQERILREATFSPNAVRYRGVAMCIGLLVPIVTIPLIPFVVPITVWYWRRQYARLRVVLTTRDLKVHRGVFMREEKSIPLEKITDLAVFDGPIMRRMGLRGIRVETAGQTTQGTALVSVVGIEGTDNFRDLVLRQRDRIAETDAEPAAAVGASAAGAVGAPAPAPDAAVLEALHAIHGTLERIERALGRREA